MALFGHVEFETPDGWRAYIAREYSTPDFSFPLFLVERVGKSDLRELGNYFVVEDWTGGPDDPMFDVGLRRTLQGWVEGWRENISAKFFTA